MFIVYFELKVPIPMKQGEGVLYATGMGIVIYNFCRDDHSVYSEPGFALHTPKANAGMSIISKASFQDIGFGYMAPPFANDSPVFTGPTDYWFPRTWFPNFVPMVLDQAPAGMRFISMYSNNNSNLPLVPIYEEDEIAYRKMERYSFTTGELYNEREQVSGLLEKLVTDGGRYEKYHPNVMLSLFENHYMLDIPELRPGKASGEGLEESKTGEYSDSDDVDPSTFVNVVASTSATPTETALIRSGSVTAEHLQTYAQEHGNRQSFAEPAPPPSEHAHYQVMVNDAIAASQGETLQVLDAHLERIRTYEANILEAEHRSLAHMQYETDVFIDDGEDDDDEHTLTLNGDHGSETAPVGIPPDDADSDTPATDVAPAEVPTPTAPAPTPTPSVIHICDTPGCRRRPESDPCGLEQVGYHACCDICVFPNGEMHTNACQAANLTTALSLAPAPAPSSGGNSGGDSRGSANIDDDWRPGWHN